MNGGAIAAIVLAAAVLVAALAGSLVFWFHGRVMRDSRLPESLRSPVTFVTAYYAVPSRAPDRVYRDRIQRLLRSLRNARLVFFAEEETCAWLKKQELAPGLELVPTPLAHADLPGHPPAYWDEEHAKNIHEAHHHSPQLYAVWHAKHRLVLRAGADRAPASRLFVWVDAGCVRTTANEKLVARWGRHAWRHLEPDRLLLLEVYPYRKVERAAGRPIDITRSNRIGATVAGGGAAAWRRWEEAHEETQGRLREMGLFVGKEQNVWTNVPLLHPESALTVRSTRQAQDDWFYLLDRMGRKSRPLHRTLQFTQLGHYGRLGNQMFQIAAVLGLSRTHNRVAVLQQDWGPARHFAGYGTSTLAVYRPSWRKLPVGRELRELGAGAFLLQPERLSRLDDVGHVDLFGYFQNWRYWEASERSVRELFRFSPELVERVKRRVQRVCPGAGFPEKACVVHVRRGDYLKHSHVHQVCDRDYYLRALGERPLDRHVVFVSDDLEWCRKEFPQASFAAGGKDPIEDLVTLALAKNKVLSNSSFSWWGAFLGQKPGESVVAPSPWIKTMPFEGVYRPGWKVLLTAPHSNAKQPLLHS